MKKERIFYLDFIRAVALVIIVLFHYNYHFVNTYNISGMSAPFYLYANGSWAGPGVVIFFLISGASLMYNYREAFELKKFYLNRIKSIYPAFYTAFFIMFMLQFYENRGIPDIPRWRIILSVLGLDGYFLYKIPNYYICGEWFLGAIIMYYTVFPVLRKMIIKCPFKSFFVFTGIVVAVFILNPFEIIIERNIIVCLYCCFLGMLWCDLCDKLKAKVCLPIAIIIMLLILFVPIEVANEAGYLFLGVSIFYVLQLLSKYFAGGRIAKISEVLSKYSYCVFLVHHVVILRIMAPFYQMELSITESFLLLILVLLVVGLATVILFDINVNLKKKIKKYS